MLVRAAWPWKVRAVRRDATARDPYPSRRMIWLAGRHCPTMSRKTVYCYREDFNDYCVKCIHVVNCLSMSVISLDPLGLS